jgi:hypothetical protein
MKEIKLFGFDPKTFKLVNELSGMLDPTQYGKNYTETVPPEYDKDVEYVVYNKKQDEWDIKYLKSPMADFKKLAKDKIDREINSVVRHNITINASNTGIYTMKYNEATGYLLNDSPKDLSEYPFLQTDVTVTGKKASTVAKKIISKYKEWIIKLNKMELLRLKGKADIDAIKTTKNPEAARQEITKISDEVTNAMFKL